MFSNMTLSDDLFDIVYIPVPEWPPHKTEKYLEDMTDKIKKDMPESKFLLIPVSPSFAGLSEENTNNFVSKIKKMMLEVNSSVTTNYDPSK